MTRFQLDPEEQQIYELAKSWRSRSFHPVSGQLDWLHFANLICANRMAVLADQALEQANFPIPADAKKMLDGQVDKYAGLTALFRGPLTTYLNAAAGAKVQTVVLKGLWLCENIYNHPAMRPGADIDILVPGPQVGDCISLLKEQGIGAYWPNLLSDEYFERHHLHQQRSSQDLKIWFEIHWALDHPYTLLTADYAGIFQRAHQGKLLGAPVLEMSPADLLLTLAIHLVKHAVYLPSLVEQPDLPRVILADGMLMNYLDVTEVLKRFSADINWDFTAQLARAWGASDSLSSVLQVCNRYLEAPVPADALAAFTVAPVSPITRNLMARAAEQKLARYENRPASRFWELLLASNGAFILRPIRLLETFSYFFPPDEYLVRRYSRASLWVRSYHLLLAIYQSLRFSADAVYFAVERYIRLKRMGKSASLFQRLDGEL